MYSDKDSLLFGTEGNDFYKKLGNSASLRLQFNLSNYPHTNSLYNNSEKLVTFKFNDAFEGAAIQSLMGLKPKTFSILSVLKQNFSAERVTQLTQRRLKHEMCCQGLLTGQLFKTINTRIGSVNHQLQTSRLNRMSLNCFDLMTSDTLKMTVLPVCRCGIIQKKVMMLFFKTYGTMLIGETVQPPPVHLE